MTQDYDYNQINDKNDNNSKMMIYDHDKKIEKKIIK